VELISAIGQITSRNTGVKDDRPELLEFRIPGLTDE
jgi:hypothetical protein